PIDQITRNVHAPPPPPQGLSRASIDRKINEHREPFHAWVVSEGRRYAAAELGTMTDDIEVIRSVIGGDVEAFGLLVERYEAAVFALIRSLLPRSGDVEDLAQEVFLTAYTQLRRFDPDQAAFATWLLTIARNRGLNALKKRQPLVFADLPDEADERTPDQ